MSDFKFSKSELSLIDFSHDGDFKGIYHKPDEAEYLSIDVFDLYKHNQSTFVVWEKRKLLFQGELQECLNYMHKWL